MIIERDFEGYVIHSEEPVSTAIKKICEHDIGRILFGLRESGVLVGLMTNGDLLRWLNGQDHPDLTQPVSKMLNRDYLFVRSETETEQIEAYLEDVNFVPIVDDDGRLTAIARERRKKEGLQIGDRRIHEDEPSFLIAEIGNNHNGRPELAKQLIDVAVESGADCAKFQMRHMDTLYRNHDGDAEAEDLGSEYTLDLLKKFNLSADQLFSLFDYCHERGIIPLCTPWDLKSLQALEEYGMPAYKVASADFTNHELLNELANTGKPLLCSTGMSHEEEIQQSVRLLQNRGAKFALLHCISTYPAPFKNVQLNYLKRLREIGECPVGYSGHERGFHVPIAAIGLGAKIIEKHITLDRTMEGNDHKVSLLPGELKKMVQRIREIEEALGENKPRELSQGERINRENLAKSIIAAHRIEEGDVINREDIDVKSPGRGLQPNRMDELIGRQARRTVESGDFFHESDLEPKSVEPKSYEFNRPWGVPVRYHDYQDLLRLSNPDLLEFHLSYRDLEEEVNDYFQSTYDLDLVVHSPELFEGDHTMNLVSPDEEYRQRSLDELQRVVKLSRQLSSHFNHCDRPFVILNVGGFTKDQPLKPDDRLPLYDKLAESLERVDTSGVELLPQTMPPYPWLFGGQRFHNLFVHPEEIANFCEEYGMNVCLDTSHSKLACNDSDVTFTEFIDIVGPYTGHLHLADAKGLDGEGLQIGEGEIDFQATSEHLEQHSPDASFIPEIWQGHKDNGKGFWIALDKLENWF